MSTPTIAISNFVRRQTPGSQFSHWTLSDEELLSLVRRHFNDATPGYRDGVVLVSVPPDGFFSNTVRMRENDILLGIYKPRKPGETPRKHIFVVGGQKVPAGRVDIVLYRNDVLAENNEHSCDADWEIISVNAEPGDDGKPAPMKPGTLMANYFRESGGTATGMTPEEFVKALGESRAYWNDKGEAAPDPWVIVPETDRDRWPLKKAVAVCHLNRSVHEFMNAVVYYGEVLGELGEGN